MSNNRERFRNIDINALENIRNNIHNPKLLLLDKQLSKSVNSVLIDRLISNTNARRFFVYWSAIFVSCWMWKVGEILVNNNDKYCLSDNVLITLLGTTTLNVLGIVAIAMYDLFNGKSEDKISSEN